MKTVLKRLFSVLLIVCMFSMAACDTKSQEKQIKSDETQLYSTNTTDDTNNFGKSISFRFINHKEFNQYWVDGVYRCGTDFPSGDYYIMSIFNAGALCDISDNPNDFTWSESRVLRKESISKGQYVNLIDGGLLVSCDEIDENNLQKYGIFLVGKDLPEGDYRIKTITDEYESDITKMSGIWGAYQISEGRPENEPIYSAILFENQTYITLKNGQYITINDAELTLVD